MATDNKGVMVYLPPDLEAVMEKYCIENKITRKTKDGGVVPSMGTGIVQYLKSQLLNTVRGSTLETALTRDDVQLMINEAMQLLRSDNSATTAIKSFTSTVLSDILPRLEALESAADDIKSQQPDKPRRVSPNLTAPTTAVYRVDR